VEEGYNPSYGARPLRRAIMRLLEDSMAERMLSGDIKEGDSVIIDVDADGQARPPLLPPCFPMASSQFSAPVPVPASLAASYACNCKANKPHMLAQ